MYRSMIFTAPDYLQKYSDTLAEIICSAETDYYSLDYVEKTLIKSVMIKEFESSNVTHIAFDSSIQLYKQLFPRGEATTDDIHLFSPHYWIGEMYIKIFLKYRVNFETIFAYLPIKKMHQLYGVYHEMDVTQFYSYFESLREKNMFAIFLREKRGNIKVFVGTN